MPENSDRFRHVMSHFATGVTIVTAADAERGPVGLTANAVASVSLVPKLLLVCMDRGSSSLAVVLRTGRFGISVLRDDDELLAKRFSEEIPDARFRGLDLRNARSGVPVLPDALAWLDCEVWKTMEAGDHVIVVGRVLDCEAASDGSPLVFFRGDYGTVAP